MSEPIEGIANQRASGSSIAADTVAANVQSRRSDEAIANRAADPEQGSLNVDVDSAANVDRVSQLANLKALGNVKLSISIDDTKQLPVIKIFDDETGKELIQIPAEHALNISRTIKAAVGAIFDTKA